jgi:NitT/TauT family transport system ATP-binding protein
MVELRDLALSYPLPHRAQAAVLHRVNARFAEGTVSAIIGPSGCGKTSLIRLMAGLLSPVAGSVLVRGNPVKGVRKGTAVIFQDYGLLPWKTVRANAELPLKIARIRDTRIKGARREGINDLLRQFGLAPFAAYYPRQLSGGMKQRLAIVRALAAEPELLLMDEPFSSLDALTREDAQDFLLDLRQERLTRQERPLTIIMVTHSIEEAVYLADTVYVMRGKNPGAMGRAIGIDRAGAAPSRSDPRFQDYCGLLRQALKEPA